MAAAASEPNQQAGRSSTAAQSTCAWRWQSPAVGPDLRRGEPGEGHVAEGHSRAGKVPAPLHHVLLAVVPHLRVRAARLAVRSPRCTADSCMLKRACAPVGCRLC